MRLRIHVWGGLAGQLSGLSTAIWVESQLGRRPEIVFHNGGVSRRDLEIRDLTLGYRVSQFFEPASLDPNGLQIPQAPSTSLVKRIGNRLAHDFGEATGITMSGSKLTMDSLRLGVRPWTRSCKGYCIDLDISRLALPVLSEKIGKTNRKNFLEGSGTEPYIAIHWRLGDYLAHAEASSFHGVISCRSLENAVKRLPAPNLPIRIYTDSPDIAQARIAKSELLSKAAVVRQDIWMDLFDMSRAQFFIGSHSGVSLWAALAIERGGTGTAFLPLQWFRSSSTTGYEPLGLGPIERYPNQFD